MMLSGQLPSTSLSISSGLPNDLGLKSQSSESSFERFNPVKLLRLIVEVLLPSREPLERNGPRKRRRLYGISRTDGQRAMRDSEMTSKHVSRAAHSNNAASVTG